jgi:conjugative relaxase-like TrwC/TraI family protein
MLSAKPQLNLRSAREYFREHLRVGDYYAAGHTVAGEWFGLGAEKLGVSGKVGEDAFLALCEGLKPDSHERLTLRKNATRKTETGRTANRRVFYDFTFSPPKSVSVVGLYQDDRILALHDRAVRVALTELERFAETRVRRTGADAERPTGNLVGALFRHDTSRELDPHLHTHCVLFNATFDPVERRWKALQAGSMYRAQKFAENLYYHELAKGLRGLGYEIENNARDFEIRQVPKAVIDRFSKRHRQIDEETRKEIEREGLHGNVNALRRQVAESRRKRKMKDSTADRLRPSWEKQMTPEERGALAKLRPKAKGPEPGANVADIMAWADARLFERRSVVQDFELWSEALARGRGEAFGLPDLASAVESGGYIRQTGTRQITARGLLRCELEIVLAAKDGRFVHAPLVPSPKLPASLSEEQRTAAVRILGSRDLVTLFRGGAGTGKSFTLKSVERELASAGHPVVVLAPQRQQVRDLQNDGLPAETLASALTRKSLPRGAVVMLDEAGQVGARDLRALVALVQAQGGRLILSGDTRQHGAVAASDALRALETYAGLQVAEINTIRRQDPQLGADADERRFIRSYREAVKAAAQGRESESFDRLDRLGCVREESGEDRHTLLAEVYQQAVERGERALVVAQTWAEVHRVNDAIRERLKAAGKLRDGVSVQIYQTLNWEEAQKRDARFYAPGHHAVFLKRYGRFERGEVCEIAEANTRGLVLLKNGRRSQMSYDYADRITVAAAASLELAPGDRLQLKLNGRSQEGHAFSNGDLVSVRAVTPDGALRVEDVEGTVKTLSAAQHVFTRGYAVTSYASQGKTVDTVLLSDAACRAATSRNQWYVAISRARRRVVVFTEDKAELRAHIRRSGDRPLALDLIPAASKPNLNGWHRRLLGDVQRVRLYQAARRMAARIFPKRPTQSIQP